MPERPEPADPFLARAGARRPGLLRELFGFVMDNKKWWLIPILVVLLVLGLLVFLSSAGLAPFLYTVF
jgi:hypothetical protein